MPYPVVGSFTSTWVTAPTSFPIAVPDKIFGLTLILDFIDRCHSLSSLHPPPAAVASLPVLDNGTAGHARVNIGPTIFGYQLISNPNNRNCWHPCVEIGTK